jgi:hypothetical protein
MQEIQTEPQETISAEDLLTRPAERAGALSTEDTSLRAVLESIVYVTEEPLSAEAARSG